MTTRALILGRRLLQRPLISPLSSTIEYVSPKTNNYCWTQHRNFSASNEEKLFNKILIANRGEIALRVLRTAEKLGIKTVSVHSTADSKALHTTMADESVCIGPPASLESYLNIDAIMKAAEDTGAEAIHPGYGFLSENAEFSGRIEKAGLKFIGPPAPAILAMGDKITSKKLASEANVNTIPGFQGILANDDEAVKVARDITYPVMIKATSGGGGKGMRICYTDDQVREGFRLSTQEAKKFFSDERLFVEKYIERPHHIEFQVIADDHDNVLVFPERECSIQRRNQKILEESPSCLLKPETRAEMVRQAKALCRQVGYRSAGTCEFLVDEEQNFYFLEMNTRLQVEHPVTEMISGVDLVEQMVRIAKGYPIADELLDAAKGNAINEPGLTAEQNEEGGCFPHKGWAIEARIYAEDPLRGFLPATGPLLQYQEPTTPPDAAYTVRVDSGVQEGTPISTWYDPMISKLVVHSADRAGAIEGLSQALDRYVIQGIGHNACFVRDVLRTSAFREGDTPTSFIPTHYPTGFQGVVLTAEEKAVLAASIVGIHDIRLDVLNMPPLPLETDQEELIAFIGGIFGEPYKVITDLKENTVTVHKLKNERAEEEPPADEPTEFKMAIPQVDYTPGESPIAEITTPSLSTPLAIQVIDENECNVITIQIHGATIPMTIMSPQEYELSKHMTKPAVEDMSDYLQSPMPGQLVSYAVKEGDVVEDGQELCIVEAMKMQNVLRSTRQGVVKKLAAEVGASLRNDEIILEFEKEAK